MQMVGGITGQMATIVDIKDTCSRASEQLSLNSSKLIDDGMKGQDEQLHGAFKRMSFNFRTHKDILLRYTLV